MHPVSLFLKIKFNSNTCDLILIYKKKRNGRFCTQVTTICINLCSLLYIFCEFRYSYYIVKYLFLKTKTARNHFVLFVPPKKSLKNNKYSYQARDFVLFVTKYYNNHDKLIMTYSSKSQTGQMRIMFLLKLFVTE